MNYQVMERNQKYYVTCTIENNLITSEQDALDLVAACGEADTFRLMLYEENLTSDFFDLRTKLAGNVLLKFANYHIKVAAVISPEKIGQGKFYEMVLETNRGNSFRVFNNCKDAEKWLINN